jgi:hypothetical protein
VLAEDELVAREAAVLPSEDQSEDLFVRKRSEFFRESFRRERHRRRPSAHRCRRDRDVRAGDGLLQGRGESRVREQVIRTARPPSRHRQQLGMFADDPQIVEAEVLHRARDRADIAGFFRFDQYDAEHFSRTDRTV